MTEKPIVISTHARQQMNLRGAKELEVITAIRTGTKRTAQKDRFRSRCEFDFNSISPINNQLYSFKAIEAIFSENTAKITVITVLVYYYN